MITYKFQGQSHRCYSPATLAAFIGSIPEIYEKAEHYVTFQWVAGKDRTVDQNALAFQCYVDLSKQLNDTFPSVDDARAYCKLYHGVGIRRRDDRLYNEQYCKFIKDRFNKEEKLEIMIGEIDFPVTRGMTRSQFSEYVERIFAAFPDVKFRALEDLGK